MKAEVFPIIITERGVSASIRETSQIKNGRKYTSYIIDYYVLGQRKREWRSDLKEAKAVALAACRKISAGEQLVLELKNEDRVAYLRAIGALSCVNVTLDFACREYAEAIKLLEGKGSLTEACRELVRRLSAELPRITVTDAVAMMEVQAERDGKSRLRRKQLTSVMKRFAEAFNVEVHTITPTMISDYLSSLPLADRSKRNHRDVIAFFCRWLVLRHYLPKNTDWLEGVQNYSARTLGTITTFEPEEMIRLLAAASEEILPFIAIAGFAGLRHAEISRLEWQDIDLEEGFIEVRAEKSKTHTRRIVPIKPNLAAWLKPISKKSGKVIPFANITKQLAKVVQRTRNLGKGIEPVQWKHNALRHTYISARVAECGDVPRVADEAGNSPQIIRTNYLKRIRPAQAAAWFAIMPECSTTGQISLRPPMAAAA